MKKIIIFIIIIQALTLAQLWKDSTATKAAVYRADSICTHFLSIYKPDKDSCVDIFTLIAEQSCSIYVKPDTYTTEGWVACGETVHIDTTDLTGGGGSDTCEHTLTIYKNLGQGSDTTFTISTCEGDTLEVYPDTCSYELYITRGGNYYDDIYVCKDGYFDIPYDSIYIQYGTSWSPEGYITHLDVLKIDTTKFVDTCSHEFYVFGYSWIEGDYYFDTINTCTPEILDLTRGIPVYQPLKWFGTEDGSTLKVTYDTNYIELNQDDELSIKDGAITTGKLADNAVTSVKIANGTIQALDIASGAIDSLRLANNAVTTAKIKDYAVTLKKINITGASAGFVIKFNGDSVVWAQDSAGSEKDTFIAYWDSIRNIPSDISNGDDIDTFIAHWDSLRGVPSDFADGVDDTGHFEPKDTFIAYWDSVRNKPTNISYLGNKIDWGELADAVQDSIQDRTDSADVAGWGYEVNPLDGAKKYGETDVIKGVLHLKEGGNITLTQEGDTITIQAATQSSTAKSDSLWHGDKYYYGDDFALAETLDNFIKTTDTIQYAQRSFDSDSLGGHPPSYYLDNTVDTFIAYWSYIREMPLGFADGIDDTGHYEPKDTFIAYWDSIRNVPSDIADGDDYDTLKANWNFIINIPSGFADGTDDIGDELAGKDTFVAYWDSIRQMPSGFADGVDNIGDELAGVDTMIAKWDSIRGIPSDIADGDDIDTFIAYWSYLRNIPSGFADGVDDTGHFEPKDTFISYWDSIRNIPNDIADGDDIDTVKANWNYIKNIPSGFSDGVDDTGKTIGTKDTMIAYWDSLRNIPSSLADGDDIDTFVAQWDSIRGKPQICWFNMYIKLDGDTIIDTVFNQDTVKSKAYDSLDYRIVIAKHLHGGSNHWRVKAISASEQINDSTTVYLCNASSDVVTLTLTTPSNNSNRLIVVKKIDNSSNKVTIDAGSSTIDGSQTYDLTTQYQSIILICDGTKWYIIADK